MPDRLIPSPVCGDPPWITTEAVYQALIDAGWTGTIGEDGRIWLWGRRQFLHAAVASIALPPRPSLLHSIDHIDRDPKNARPENLRWATASQQRRNQTLGPYAFLVCRHNLWRVSVRDHAGRRHAVGGFPTIACAMAGRRVLLRAFQHQHAETLPAPNVPPRRKAVPSSPFLDPTVTHDRWGIECWDRPGRADELAAWLWKFGGWCRGQAPPVFEEGLSYESVLRDYKKEVLV